MMIFFFILSAMTLIALGFIWRASSMVPLMFLIILGLAWLQWGNEKEVSQWLELKKLRTELGHSADTVIKRLKKQLETNPNSAKGWYLLGKLYLSQENYTEAVEVFAKANHLQPDDPETLLNYGQALLMAKQSKEAAAIWRKLRSHYPDDSEEAKTLDAAIKNIPLR
ncbi:MAG: tetratricopeptide repeat protein [Gammaproteobacteria bacterium]